MTRGPVIPAPLKRKDIMKTIARIPMEENRGYHIYQPIKYVVGELIIKEDENGHFHSIATYFDKKVERKKYFEIMKYAVPTKTVRAGGPTGNKPQA